MLKLDEVVVQPDQLVQCRAVHTTEAIGFEDGGSNPMSISVADSQQPNVSANEDLRRCKSSCFEWIFSVVIAAFHVGVVAALFCFHWPLLALFLAAWLLIQNTGIVVSYCRQLTLRNYWLIRLLTLLGLAKDIRLRGPKRARIPQWGRPNAIHLVAGSSRFREVGKKLMDRPKQGAALEPVINFPADQLFHLRL
jgi:hypothetical protein